MAQSVYLNEWEQKKLYKKMIELKKAGGDLSSRPGGTHLPGSPYAGAASGAAHSR